MPKIAASFLSILLLISCGVWAEDYTYIDPLSNDEGLRIGKEPRYIVFRGHLGLEWEECESGGVCLASRDLVISLPSSVEGSWVAEGVAFDGEYIGDISFLGWAMGAGYRVSSIQGGVKYQFLYAKHYGLMAISASAKDRGSVFLISQSRCAFGAAQACKE